MIIFLGMAIGAIAQKPLSSTYVFNGMMVNPAYAGALNLLSATVTHRDQWVNLDGAPSHQSFNAHTSLYNNTIGVGILGMRDQIGIHVNTSLYGAYSYKLRTSLGIMSFGLQGGFDSQNSNWNQLNVVEESDSKLRGLTSSFKPNFGMGFLFYNKDVFAGVSIPYALRNKVYNKREDESINFISDSEARKRRTYYLYGGTFIHLSPNVVFNPSAYIRMIENAPLGYDLNATFILQEIAYVGAMFKSRDGLSFLLQLILNENFSVGYAYDYALTSLNNGTPGSHEIILNYRRKVNFTRDAQCPVYY